MVVRDEGVMGVRGYGISGCRKLGSYKRGFTFYIICDGCQVVGSRGLGGIRGLRVMGLVGLML